MPLPYWHSLSADDAGETVRKECRGPSRRRLLAFIIPHKRKNFKGVQVDVARNSGKIGCIVVKTSKNRSSESPGFDSRGSRSAIGTYKEVPIS